MPRCNTMYETPNPATTTPISPLVPPLGLSSACDPASASDPLNTTTNTPRLFSFSLRASYNHKMPPADFSGIGAIGFDLDGVFFNDVNFHELVAQVFCERYHCYLSLHQIKAERESGRDLWDVAREKVWEVKQIPHTEVERQLREIEEYTVGHMRDFFLVCPAAVHWLRNECPIPLFVATNRDTDVCEEALLDLGLTDIFRGIYSRSKAMPKKPAPDMIVRARDEVGFEGKVLFVDDSPVNHRPMVELARPHGIEIETVGCLPPGYGFSHKLEHALWNAGAQVVVPTVNHFIRDLAKNFDPSAYERIKAEMKVYRQLLDMRSLDPSVQLDQS